MVLITRLQFMQLPQDKRYLTHSLLAKLNRAGLLLILNKLLETHTAPIDQDRGRHVCYLLADLYMLGGGRPHLLLAKLE